MFLKRKEKERKGKRKRERWKEKDETGLAWHREIPHALEQRSLCNTTTEPALRASSAQLESGPHLPQLDRVCMKQ